MTHEQLIEEAIRKTTAEVARLATRGGARASLASVTDQVFLQLSRELSRQGVTKSVIADMFGMGLRTYHRRVRYLRDQQVEHRTLCETVLELVRESEPISGHAVQQHFLRHPAELVAGALNDLVHTRRVMRIGWGEDAVFRVRVLQAAAEATLGSAQPVGHVRVAGQRG